MTSSFECYGLLSLPCTNTTDASPAMTTAAPAQQGPKTLPPSTTLQQQRMPQQSAQHTGLRTPSNRKTIYDRNLNRTRTAELSRASFAYLFGEMVGYAQKRVTGIQDLERRCAFTIQIISNVHTSASSFITAVENLFIRILANKEYIIDSTKQATPSASASSPFYFSVPQPLPTQPRVPLASSRSCNSSPTHSGGIFLPAPLIPSKAPRPITTNT